MFGELEKENAHVSLEEKVASAKELQGLKEKGAKEISKEAGMEEGS